MDVSEKILPYLDGLRTLQEIEQACDEVIDEHPQAPLIISHDIVDFRRLIRVLIEQREIIKSAITLTSLIQAEFGSFALIDSDENATFEDALILANENLRTLLEDMSEDVKVLSRADATQERDTNDR